MNWTESQMNERTVMKKVTRITVTWGEIRHALIVAKIITAHDWVYPPTLISVSYDEKNGGLSWDLPGVITGGLEGKSICEIEDKEAA